MELFEVTVSPKYQEVLDNHGPIAAESIELDIIQPLGFSGADEDLEIFQETLAELAGSADIAVTAAQLQEAVHTSREEIPEAWRGNWAVLVDSHHGQFCPQITGQHLVDSKVRVEGIARVELQVLQEGPEHANYWETWKDVLNSCVIVAEGERFTLVHDGDVFLVPVD